MFVLFDPLMAAGSAYSAGFLAARYQIKGDNGLGGKGGHNPHLRDEWTVSSTYSLGSVATQTSSVKGNKSASLQILPIYLFL